MSRRDSAGWTMVEDYLRGGDEDLARNLAVRDTRRPAFSMPSVTGARLAVIGAGPAGLVAAKHAVASGFDTTVFEAGDDIGGQWHTAASHSAIWPGMRTNTSRMMTAFSDFPPPETHALYPFAEQVQDYLRGYAAEFNVAPLIRLGTPITSVQPGWTVDGESFDRVIVATGRFRSPHLPTAISAFTGELLHAHDYPGAGHFRGRRVLVYGNGVSGHEIASDLATSTSVISAYRKPRYVLQKVVAGVPSDWQWYTHVGALRRAAMPPAEYGRMLGERVVRVAGNPADFGAPAPNPDIMVAGLSLSQHYLEQVSAGQIICRPAIAEVNRLGVEFVDGTCESVDAIICATGYDLAIPSLSDQVWSILGGDLRLHHRTFHPDLPGLAIMGQFALQGPYFPLLELQARWIINSWSGEIAPPAESAMRASLASAAPVTDSHNVLAVTLSHAAGVAPDLDSRPELIEPLLLGPMLPVRYRLDGPGAQHDAALRFTQQLASSPRAVPDADDVAALTSLGLRKTLDLGSPTQ
jgi:dimethylaniline monooxygenase (N-oxide forming)